MFLSYLMDMGDTCMDKTFTSIFFVIGMFHFVCGIVEELTQYAEQASDLDGVISPMEDKIMWSSWLLLHALRLAEFPLVVVLGYYSIKFSLLEGDMWTHVREEVKPENGSVENCTVCFCEGNYVHLAQITFIFQAFYGVVLVVMWWTLWYVDREDDEGELEEELEWQRNEALLSTTWLGMIWEVVLLIGMHSFYNEEVAGTMLALSVALPHEDCNIHVLEWFLYAGIIYTLSGVINKVRERVEDMAIIDGIINKAEHRIIMLLKFINFPLFLFEFLCFIMIGSLVITNASYITFDENSPSKEYYCEEGTWTLMVAMNVMYSMVFLFRVVVILAALCGRGEDASQADQGCSQ